MVEQELTDKANELAIDLAKQITRLGIDFHRLHNGKIENGNDPAWFSSIVIVPALLKALCGNLHVISKTLNKSAMFDVALLDIKGAKQLFEETQNKSQEGE